ncbi:protein-L-isoaspartate(D-aspartate) O-methyltransferase [Thermodesulfobacteriota bacterium]
MYRHSGCFFLCLSLIVAITLTCRASDPSDKAYDDRREAMVKNQIEGRGISNQKVLQALRKVERHLFVPPAYRSEAYNDHPLPIGEGQTISQPYIVALMTEILVPDKGKKILEIGTGSGYQAAILAELYDQVYTIEIVEILGQRAGRLLDDLGYKNIKVKIGDGYKGWKEYSPFDAIIVTCAPSHIPQPLKDQLAEGGKMVIPVGERFEQKMVLLTKEKGIIREKNMIPVRFVPMMQEDGREY